METPHFNPKVFPVKPKVFRYLVKPKAKGRTLEFALQFASHIHLYIRNTCHGHMMSSDACVDRQIV